MNSHLRQAILASLLSTTVSGLLAQEKGVPDAKSILKSVRIAQGAQNRTVEGRLRTRGKTIPFTLTMAGDTIRWDFTDPAQSLFLRLGEKDSRLEESGRSGTERISGARFDEKVRDSDVSYEDLSMRFLYWPKAEVEGEQTMVLTKCWIVRVEPSARTDSQYSKVRLWVSKNDGALMQAEAFDTNGKLARRFKVLSGQKTADGFWILKQMRIEATAPGRSSDRTPTYLEIEKPGS